jgi:hypothetical protein
MTEQKSVSAGRRLRRFGGFAGGAAPANVQLTRRNAASDNKTNIPAWIFPNARLLYSKTRCDRFVRDVLRAFAKLAASFELKTAHPTKDLRLPHALVSIRHKQNQMSWNRKFSRQVFSLMPASGGCFPQPRS